METDVASPTVTQSQQVTGGGRGTVALNEWKARWRSVSMQKANRLDLVTLPCPPPHSLASYGAWTLDMGSRLSWLIQNPEKMNVAIKDQIKIQFSDWFVQMFFFFIISTFISQGVHLLDQIAKLLPSASWEHRSLDTVHSLRLLVFANRVYDK